MMVATCVHVCVRTSVCICVRVCACACVFSLSTYKYSLILEKHFCKIYSDLDAIVLVRGKWLERTRWCKDQGNEPRILEFTTLEEEEGAS